MPLAFVPDPTLTPIVLAVFHFVADVASVEVSALVALPTLVVPFLIFVISEVLVDTVEDTLFKFVFTSFISKEQVVQICGFIKCRVLLAHILLQAMMHL